MLDMVKPLMLLIQPTPITKDIAQVHPLVKRCFVHSNTGKDLFNSPAAKTFQGASLTTVSWLHRCCSELSLLWWRCFQSPLWTLLLSRLTFGHHGEEFATRWVCLSTEQLRIAPPPHHCQLHIFAYPSQEPYIHSTYSSQRNLQCSTQPAAVRASLDANGTKAPPSELTAGR